VAEELARGDTEVSVLIPRRIYRRLWHRLLHDRTANAIASALGRLPHANVTFVPYHLGSSHDHDIPHSPPSESGQDRRRDTTALR
jgi:hypothetical protein